MIGSKSLPGSNSHVKVPQPCHKDVGLALMGLV